MSLLYKIWVLEQKEKKKQEEEEKEKKEDEEEEKKQEEGEKEKEDEEEEGIEISFVRNWALPIPPLFCTVRVYCYCKQNHIKTLSGLIDTQDDGLCY